MGREPLSTWARMFSALVLLVGPGLLGLFGWSASTRTPDDIARQKLARADELAAAGKPAESARLSQEVAQGPSPRPGLRSGTLGPVSAART